MANAQCAEEVPPTVQNHAAVPRAVAVASYVLMAAGLLLVMWRGLLPGLLSLCLGFVVTTALAGWFSRKRAGARSAVAGRGGSVDASSRSSSRSAQVIAAILVMLLPLALLAAGVSHSRSYIVDAPQQYRELLVYLARTVLELREKLPQDVAAYLPDGAEAIQRTLAAYLAAQAGALAMAGRAWLGGLLYAYVGLLIGALAAVRMAPLRTGPLSLALGMRLKLFGESFRQIVAAQIWIAAFNTTLTTVFLTFFMPIWGGRLPYTAALITLTFVAGLVPIVGNLLCNVVITLVALSVSPQAAAACLVFLVVIHKAEYVINAKVVGQRTHMAVWELLCVMFVAEAVFGPAGLVAAPLLYAYVKKELDAERLV